MLIVPASEMHCARRQCGNARVFIGNLVLAFRLKRDSSGKFLSDELMRKARLTIADKKINLADDTVDFYSACVSPGTSRIITKLALERGVLQHIIDVGGAYYKGTSKLPEDGGRLVYARVPAYHR
jgi:hypothetical protein